MNLRMVVLINALCVFYFQPLLKGRGILISMAQKPSIPPKYQYICVSECINAHTNQSQLVAFDKRMKSRQIVSYRGEK